METRLESFDIAVDDHHVCSTLFSPAAALPGVLFVHGWGGSQEQDLARAKEAVGLGCVCLTFDLRGHERTERLRATVSRAQNLRDLVAAYDWFVSQPNVEPTAIAVVGISYGAYLAAILTSLRPVNWLALRAPALYKDEGWELPKRDLNADPDLQAYRRRSVRWQDNRALGACAAFEGDALVVASEHDEIMPHAVIGNYIAAFRKTRTLTTRVIAGADHSLSQKHWRHAYSTLLLNWFTEMIVSARADAAKSEVEHRKLEIAATA